MILEFVIIMFFTFWVVTNLFGIMTSKVFSAKGEQNPQLLAGLLATALNLVFVFCLIGVYFAKGNIQDVDFFVMITLINCVGYVPMVCMLLGFQVQRKEKKSRRGSLCP